MREHMVKTAAILFALIMSNLTSANLAAATPDAAELSRMAARFASTELRVDLSGLTPADRQALARLIQAARIYNEIFLRQCWAGNLALYQKLKQDQTPLGRARLHYFWLNKGPWSEIDNHQSFI